MPLNPSMRRLHHALLASAFTVPLAVEPARGYDLRVASVGGSHTVATDTWGDAWAWGNNTYGQLGNDDSTAKPQNRPVAVYRPVTGLQFDQIVAGRHHSLAIDTTGKLWGWGRNDRGQAGTGSTSGPVWRPSAVTALPSGVLQVAAGVDFSIALRSDGTVWAFGLNDRGQLGIGSPVTYEATPTKVTVGGTVTAIAAGVDFSIALKSDGTLLAWGANDKGQIGNGGGPTTDQFSPVAVTGLGSIVSIAAGGSHGLAVKKVTGTPIVWSLWGWGSNSDGQLGTGTSTATPVRTPVQAISPIASPVVDVAAGRAHSIGLLANGTVVSCGANDRGQLGIGSSTVLQKSSLTMVPGLRYAAEIGAGGDSSVAREYAPASRIERTLWTWGAGTEGQIGEGRNADGDVVRRVWFFSVGPGTGCRDVDEYIIGYEASTKALLTTELGSLGTGSIVADVANPTPTSPGRGYFLYRLGSLSKETALLAYLTTSSTPRYHEKNCRLFAAAASRARPTPTPTPTPPPCPVSSAFPQDFGYRKENNRDCVMREDPAERWQHNLQHTDWEAAWARMRNSTQTPWDAIHTVRVAILDTGLDRHHIDLDPLSIDLPGSRDFVRGTAPNYAFGADGVTDPDYWRHGTGVASLLIARTNDTLTARGIASTSCFGKEACSRSKKQAWKHPALLAVMRVLDENRVGTPFTVSTGVLHARDVWGAEVINMSLGSLVDSPTVAEACDRARLYSGGGAILVAAAGNLDLNSVMYPAAYQTVMGVGATQELAYEVRAPWSNYGVGVDVWAPGERVLVATGPNSITTDWSTVPPTHYNYGYPDGTSYTAPLASGLAVLARARRPITDLIRRVECAIRTEANPIVSEGGGGKLIDANLTLVELDRQGNAPPPATCVDPPPNAPPVGGPGSEEGNDYSGGIGFAGGDVPPSKIK